jgi:anaerobic ribonucleoside-triphosphate reductase activating protein
MQSDEVLIDICQLVYDIKEKYPDKNIWLYTGYKYEELQGIQLDILHYIDVLVDGPFELDKKDTTLAFRGSYNQRIINLNELY